MTDVSFNVPPLPFPSLVSQQQAQSGEGQRQLQQGDGVYTPPRHSIQSNETFIPRGTPAADLASLFPRAQLGA